MRFWPDLAHVEADERIVDAHGGALRARRLGEDGVRAERLELLGGRKEVALAHADEIVGCRQQRRRVRPRTFNSADTG